MKQKIQIRCKNNKKSQKVEIGSTLFDVFSSFDLKMTHGPVSYTHLDVYKRQYQSLLQKEFDIMKHVQHPGVAEVMGIEEVDGYGTVSYTHLDVYKRQILCRI